MQSISSSAGVDREEIDQDVLVVQMETSFPFRFDYPWSLQHDKNPVWTEMLAYAGAHFGPDGVKASERDWYKWGFSVAQDARWAWDGKSLHFKSLADATMFKLRWC